MTKKIIYRNGKSGYNAYNKKSYSNPYADNQFALGGIAPPSRLDNSYMQGVAQAPDFTNKGNLGMQPTAQAPATDITGSIGGVASGLKGLVDTYGTTSSIKDTSGTQANIAQQNQLDFTGNSTNDLMSQWGDTNLLSQVNASDYRQSLGSQISGTLGGIGAGAAAGSFAGPIGTIAGAAAGLLTGVGGAIIGNNNAKRAARRLNQRIDRANTNVIDNFSNSAMNTSAQQDASLMSNYFANGGTINPVESDYKSNITTFNTGGSHEQNPNNGIPIGQGQNGQPNLVEEGEVKYKDYIFSNRIPINKDLINKLNLPTNIVNHTFASAAEKLSQESEERPNDPISKKGLEATMEKLKSAQEIQKMQEQQAQQMQQNIQPQNTQMPQQFAVGGNLNTINNRKQNVQSGSIYSPIKNPPIGLEYDATQLPFNNPQFYPKNFITEPDYMKQPSTLEVGPTIPTLSNSINKAKLRTPIESIFNASWNTEQPTRLNLSAPKGIQNVNLLDTQYTNYKSNDLNNYSNVSKNTIANGNYFETTPELEKTLGFKNNNFGNIRKNANINWQGQVKSDNAFAKFDTVESGIRAQGKLLNTYMTKHNLKTPREIINRWAPPSENDTTHYVDFVAKQMGIDPDTKISASDYKTMGKLMAAMSLQETGVKMDSDKIGNLYNEMVLQGRGIGNTNAYINKDNYSAENQARLAKNAEVTRNPLGAAAKDIMQNNTIAINKRFNPIENIDAYHYRSQYPEIPDNTALDNFQQAARYAPIAGSVLNTGLDLAGVTNQNDYRPTPNLAPSRDASIPFTYNPINTYEQYQPMDRDYRINQLNANAAATRRGIANTSGGNRAVANAGLLAADANYGTNLGNLSRQAAEYNMQNRQRVDSFNRATDQANAQMDMQTQQSNYQRALQQQQMQQNINRINLENAFRNEQARQQEATATGGAKSANISGLFSNIGNLGNEYYNRNMLDSNLAELYTSDSKGNLVLKKPEGKKNKKNNKNASSK